MKLSAFSRALLPLLKLPEEPPEMPADGHTTVRVTRASPRYLHYQYLKLGLTLLGSIFAFFWVAHFQSTEARPAGGSAWVALARWWPVALAGFVVLQSALRATFARVAWELRYYIITDKSLRIREGALQLREMTLTFQNVQNVNIEQGPLQRLFGFAEVTLRTAGGSGTSQGDEGAQSGHQAVLHGLENAAEIRDLIRDHLASANGSSGLGDPDDPRALEERSVEAGASGSLPPQDAPTRELPSGAHRADATSPLLGEILDELRLANRALATPREPG